MEKQPPLLRVYLLGTFKTELPDGSELAMDTLFGRIHSEILLKLLLSHPERRVTRDRLAEIIWPGHSYASIGDSLDVAKSVLKTRLEQACGGSLIPRVSGDPPCYSLAGQTILWTDVDACEQFIRHAVNTSETQDALRSWENAYALLQRGVLLAQDQASYWYEARFVQDRCKKLARQRTQCVLRIADLCCVCGDLERAVTVLEAESEAHPAHEEVVFQLMNLLANQGRSSEALQYFTCLETALLEKDAEPREETKVLAHRLRTTGTTKQGTSSILGSARLQDQMASRGHAADRIGAASQLPALLETKGPFEHRRADWGEAPSPEQFYGRDEELTRLKTWIVEDHGRLVSILGMGGIGKTSLAVVLASQLQGDFEYVFWRSLYNAPLLPSVLQDCIKLLSDQQRTDLPDNPDDQIALLIEYLRVHRCLLILDNVETILQGGTESGSYREGYEGYKKVFQRIGETRHDSCLLLTSREKPPEVALLEGKLSPVRSQHLSGVGQQEGRELLSDKGLFGSDHAWSMLIHLYAGNPLALKLISEPIRELFNANIDEFLKEEHTVVGNIHELLDQQFQRLPARERDIMYWLAIEREAVSLETLWEDTVSFVSKKALLNALASLKRRSMIETGDAARITLQPVIMEYVTDEFTRYVSDEIHAGAASLLASHALLKAQAKEYVRETQVRLILMPILEQLLARLTREELEQKCKALLASLHEGSPQKPNYAAGNLLNLLIQMRYDLRGYDFSRLSIHQAFLQGELLPQVNFAYADISASVFTDTFGSVLSVAFHPDGNVLAAGTASGEVRLWDVANGMPLHTCRGHMDWVRSVAFRPDGQMIASGSEDQTVKLWDVHTGQCFMTLEGHVNRVRSVAFNPDGKLIASGSEDQTVRLWDASTGQCLRILQGHTDQVRAIAFSPDGCVVASGSEDQTVRLWDADNGQCLRILQGHACPIFSVAFSPDGQHIASAGEDQAIRLWEISSERCLSTFVGHKNRVRSVAFHPNGQMVASASEDQTVRLWDVSTGQHLKTLDGHTGSIFSIAFRVDGSMLTSGSEDQTVRLWDTSTGQHLKTLRGYADQIRSIAFNSDGSALASGSEDQTVRIWQVQSGQCIRTFQGHTNRVRSVAFSPGGQMVASGSEDQTVRLWDVSTGQCLNILQGHTNRVRSVAFSPDGSTIASASEDQTIRVWEVSDGQCLRTLQGHASWIWSIAFHPGGDTLVSGSEDQTVRLWDLKSGRHLRTLQGHTDRIRSVAFSSDGTMLASGSEDQTVRIWDARSGLCIKILRGHTSWVWAVAFSPDENTVASGSHDGTVKIWEVRTGACLKTLRGHRPYEGMNVTGTTGLTLAQKTKLKELGAIEDEAVSLSSSLH